MASYSFSEGVGTTTADSSINNNILTLNSTTWTTGHTGSGLMNTTASAGASADFIASDKAITLMAWIRPLDLTSGSTHFAMGFIDSGDNTQVALFTQRGNFGTIDVVQANVRINGVLYELHGSALTVGTWVHIACTYNGLQAVLYVNGVVVWAISQSGALGTGDGFYVAGRPAGTHDTDVEIDDVRVFDVALSRNQIIYAMNRPV